MNREEAKVYLIGKMEEYLLQRGLSDACVHHNWHFRCFSPDHEDKHPSMSFNRSANKVHCFGCGVTYDIFDLIGLDYGLKDYNSQFQKACELFNVTVDNKPAKNSLNMGRSLIITKRFFLLPAILPKVNLMLKNWRVHLK